MDIGVESYFAFGGLKPSHSSLPVVGQGGAITLSNFTVVNNSYSTATGLTLRFYLSQSITIDTLDYQLGGDHTWYWPTFGAESYFTGGYVTFVPITVPPGIYYIGANVTMNGLSGDNYAPNNTTLLPNRITVTAVDDAYEQNGTISTPYDLTRHVGRPLSDILGRRRQYDNDYYNLWILDGRDSIDVSVTFDHSLGDIDIKLMTYEGTIVGQSEGLGNMERITLQGISLGRYALQVYYSNVGNYYDINWRDYKLTFEDNYEQNDTRETAYELHYVNNLYLAGVNGSGYQHDEDYYRIFIDQGQNAANVECYFDASQAETTFSSSTTTATSWLVPTAPPARKPSGRRGWGKPISTGSAFTTKIEATSTTCIWIHTTNQQKILTNQTTQWGPPPTSIPWAGGSSPMLPEPVYKMTMTGIVSIFPPARTPSNSSGSIAPLAKA